ncbi:NAD(P)H-binding protein [Occultella aeris]|uniref:Putative sugar epimerase YhfK n=1 Tax=Occultella aeris TaxID=2761496 RepID=A0A7M4DHU1_9MICO|nr:NAD(P)H-binding protein [Occultella aeris]VZO36486.1 putative sugar epimerase YhfK [Occultella aeris]
MHVAIAGAGGRVGLELARQLTAAGHTATGIHRNPDHTDAIAAAGATPAHGDLIADDAQTLAAHLDRADAVVFAAGAHGTGTEQTSLIDGDGLLKTIDAARIADVTRIAVLSAFPESVRSGELGPTYEHYLRVKKAAEHALTESDRDWLILRPGHMTDDPAHGTIAAGAALPDEADVSRADVIAFLVSALQHPKLGRAIVELTDGDTSITAAVEATVARSAPRTQR